MPEGLEEAFDAVITEGDGGGETPEVLSQNAKIHWGDTDDLEISSEVSDETEDDDDSLDLDVDDDNDDAEDIDPEEDDATEPEFDFDRVKNQLVTIKVNGETIQVPLDEVRNGYMRQADYTRKTQQVAADMQVVDWARAIQREFQTNPEGAVKYLAQQFNVRLVDEPDPYEDIDPEFKPVIDELNATRRELAEMKAWRESQENVAVQREVQAELDAVRAKYSDFDPQVVLPIAIENGLTMEKAYKLWRADQMENETAAAAEARRVAEAAALKREKARSTGKKVASGQSKAKGSADDSWKKFESFEDIFDYEMNKL